jgi:hypothetical protein
MANKKKPQNKKKNFKSEKTSIFRRLLRWGFILAIWGGLILLVLIAWYAKDL